MKKSSLTLISLFALSGPVFGQVASDLVTSSSAGSGTHQFTQSGATSDLTLCTHELCYLDDRGFLHVEHVAAGSIASVVAQASDPEADKYLVFYPAGQEGNRDKLRVLRNRYLVSLADGANLDAIKDRCGMESIRLFREGSNLAICEESSAGRVLGQLTNVLNDPQIISAEPIFAKKRAKRFVPTDPFYDEQWYLQNNGTNGGVLGVDIKLEGALDDATGSGVHVVVVDDGVAIDHDDLATNATDGPHLNFFRNPLTLALDPTDPTTLDVTADHGTAVAGLIAAEFNNGGMSGVAPQATLSAVRLLGSDGFTLIDDEQEAESLIFDLGQADIYNNSWGPIDSTLDLAAPGPLVLEAFETGVETGRVVGGEAKGAIYVWAGGNGGEIFDRSDYDGYASSKYTIAVGALDDAGRKSIFSEPGSNLVVAAPSSGGSQGIFTTTFGIDFDDDDLPFRTSLYRPDFGGTSASAPMVSGVVALMLEANPELNWREVQDILIRTAAKVDPGDGDWIDNADGISFNHKYGAGLVNADAAVDLAASRVGMNPIDPGTMEPIPEGGSGPLERHTRTRIFTANPSDPIGDSGLVPDNDGSSLLATFDMSVDANGDPRPNLKVEHVELRARIITQSRTDLDVVLISPNGTQSVLHAVDLENDEQSITNWTFMTVRNWGEGSAGTWILRVTDRITGNDAVLNNVTLAINGVLDPVAPVADIPILTSASFITVNQEESLSYIVESEGAVSVAIGDLPDGVTFDPVTSTISGAIADAGLYSIPIVLTDEFAVDGNFALTIIVLPTAIALGDAVGLPGIPAIFGGDLPWAFELVDTNGGGDNASATSAAGLANGQSSIFGFDNLGEGVLLFDWKASSEPGADRLYFNRGGEAPQAWDAFISGSKEWATSAVILPDFSNDVRWIYSKDAEKDFGVANSAGEDRGLVDNIQFIEMDKYMQDVIDAGLITGFTPEFDSRMTFYPKVVPFASPAPGGVEPLALASPSIGNGQTASMSTWVEGPGVFEAQVLVYAHSSDTFELLVDGVLVDSEPGNLVAGAGLALKNVSWSVPAGRHRIQLRFRKDLSDEDAGQVNGAPFEGIILDNMTYIADGSFEEFVSDFADDFGAAYLAAFGVPFDPSPTADGDGDGYSNFEEYAFGGDMMLFDTPQYLPMVVTSGGSSFIEYGIDTSRLDLDYTAQESTDLLTWADAQLATLDRMEGDVEVYRIPVSAAGFPELFFRVIAENN